MPELNTEELVTALRTAHMELGSVRERLSGCQSEIDDLADRLDDALEARDEAIEQGRDDELGAVVEYLKQLVVDRMRLKQVTRVKNSIALIEGVIDMLQLLRHRR